MIRDSERRQYSVKLFVRAEPTLGTETQKEAVMGRLSDLSRDGAIEPYEVHVWPRSIRRSGPLCETAYHRNVFSHLEELRRWADESGVSLNFAYEERTIDCSITGEIFSVVCLPTMCLAVYDDGLRRVYPYCDEEGIHPIGEFLESIEAGERPLD